MLGELLKPQQASVLEDMFDIACMHVKLTSVHVIVLSSAECMADGRVDSLKL